MGSIDLSGIVGMTQKIPTASAAPGKTKDAAQQFEALLIGELLRGAHDKDSGWLGQSDSSSDCATGYAEEQLAAAMAQSGGFGLAALIQQGLDRKS